MKKGISRLATALSFAVLLSSTPKIEAGFIDLLRGEKVSAPFQRMAFVGPAVVKNVEGRAERLAGVDRWLPLMVGDKLQPGDLLRTREGKLVLRMEQSGSFIRVTPNTQVRLTEFQAGWDRAVLTGQEERQGFAVRACRGTAHYQESGGEWRGIAVNMVIPEGTPVRIQEGAILDLYSTSERRVVRVGGQKETTLSAALFQRKSTQSVAIVSR